MATGHASSKDPLCDAELGRGVDPGAWRALVESITTANEQRNARCQQAQMEIESTGHASSEDGVKPYPSEKLCVEHDGDCHRRMCEIDGVINVAVANPRQSFFLYKKAGQPQWTRGDPWPSGVPTLEYLSSSHWPAST